MTHLLAIDPNFQRDIQVPMMVTSKGVPEGEASIISK